MHNAPIVGKLNFIQLNLARKKPTVIVEPLEFNHLWNFWVMCLDHFFFPHQVELLGLQSI